MKTKAVRLYGKSDLRLEEFELPEYKQLLKDLGVEGEWEGIGHCVVGYADGDLPKAAPRKENRVFWVE